MDLGTCKQGTSSGQSEGIAMYQMDLGTHRYGTSRGQSEGRRGVAAWGARLSSHQVLALAALAVDKFSCFALYSLYNMSW